MNNTSYVVDEAFIDHDRLRLSISQPDQFKPTKREKKWHSLILKLPQTLLSALLAELKLKNRVRSIQYADWPQKGSVVINLAEPFKNDFLVNDFGVKYRRLNDPHYWIADVHEIVDGVEHLIIT